MRKIKFRVWIPTRNEWYDGPWEFHIKQLCNYDPANYYVMQQFTGLKDKTGREIYEGDILQYQPDYSESEGGQIGASLSTVTFESGSFLVGGESLWDACTVMEIVGNIFENSDLLKND